ncbi:MAG: hypothetical protein FWD89_05305 [Firmicutes bacterium]|nr:hypothetical protein [Bacillota bacterium]
MRTETRKKIEAVIAKVKQLDESKGLKNRNKDRAFMNGDCESLFFFLEAIFEDAKPWYEYCDDDVVSHVLANIEGSLVDIDGIHPIWEYQFHSGYIDVIRAKKRELVRVTVADYETLVEGKGNYISSEMIEYYNEKGIHGVDNVKKAYFKETKQELVDFAKQYDML